jgi:hypothetical protein
MATYLDASLNINDVSYNTDSILFYTGQVFAFPASGGYTVEQGFATIHRLSEQKINIFDTTSSVQVDIYAEVFNNKIGIYKNWNGSSWDICANHLNADGSNYVFYNDASNLLITDSLTLDASGFVGSIKEVYNVVSVGKLSTIYMEFAQYVASYFGLVQPSTGNVYPSDASGVAQGFATLFSGDFQFNPNGGVFDETELFHIIHDGDGSFNSTTQAGIDNLKGQIAIDNITALLRNAVDANPFGNRDPSGGTTAIDPADRSNYGVTDGFMPGDLIFIPDKGFTITMNLNIDYKTTINNYVSNNVGPGNAVTFQSGQDASWNDTSFNSGNAVVPSTFHETTVTTTSLLSRTVAAPLLIRLIDRPSPSTNYPNPGGPSPVLPAW